VLGLLGNTGNTDAPHLHFHMMDGPAPLLSNGIPYVFTTFVGNGAVTDADPVFEGKPTPIDAASLAGPHRDVLPRDLQLVTFPAPTRP
jgi:murein DD-endopeptidase MepM/ murein hydrolase activator NlpD